MTSNEGSSSGPAGGGPAGNDPKPPASDRDRGEGGPGADEPPIDLDSARDRAS